MNKPNSRITTESSKAILKATPLLRQVQEKYSGPGNYPNAANFTVTVKNSGIYLFLAPQLSAWASSQIILTITSWQCSVDAVLKNSHNWTFSGTNPANGSANVVTIKGSAYPADVYLIRIY